MKIFKALTTLVVLAVIIGGLVLLFGQGETISIEKITGDEANEIAAAYEITLPKGATIQSFELVKTVTYTYMKCEIKGITSSADFVSDNKKSVDQFTLVDDTAFPFNFFPRYAFEPTDKSKSHLFVCNGKMYLCCYAYGYPMNENVHELFLSLNGGLE